MDYSTYNISELAWEVKRDWDNVNFAVAPYLSAMCNTDSIDDMFGADSARSIVAYFLSNANSWRGPVARAVKAELRARLGR